MWFTASLLFESKHQNASGREPLWEEEIVLFEAADESTAKQRATLYGKAQEHEYRNKDGELVRWSFRQVERLYEVEASVLMDGTELFSRFLRDSEVKSLLTPLDD